MATGRPYAADTFARVDRTLREYDEAAAAQRIHARIATEVRHEQSAALMDLRMACLDRRLAEVDALVGLLRRGDDQAGEALPIAEDALRIAGKPDAPSQLLARARFAVARALAALGREPERSRKLAEEARAGVIAHPQGQATQLAEIDRWLQRKRSRPGKL
jgi:hypothetical protein